MWHTHRAAVVAHVQAVVLQAFLAIAADAGRAGSGSRATRSPFAKPATSLPTPSMPPATSWPHHVKLAAQSGVKVYFCDRHSTWQSGTCENTNGSIRQYLPKGTELAVFSQEELDGIRTT